MGSKTKIGACHCETDDCDGVLNMNPTISRHHCRVNRVEGGWYVTDLDSSNGTCVGDMYLTSGQMMPIHNGDRIRISDMEFIIQM